MKEKYIPSEDEVACFRESMDGVQRIQTDKIEHNLPKPPPEPVQTRKDDALVMKNLLNSSYDLADIQPGDTLDYSRPGLHKKIIRKLRKGQYTIATELDLHGMTTSQSIQALTQFMKQARSLDACCVRIIHGKGHRSSNHGPVLKPLVYHWLRRRDEVLAFTSARPVDGGTGALYVLLKRQSKN